MIRVTFKTVCAGSAAAVFAVALAMVTASAQVRETAEIDRVQDQYRQAWQRADLDGVMRFWTPDARMLGAGTVVEGTAAIRESLLRSMRMGIFDLRDEDREVYGGSSSVVEVRSTASSRCPLGDRRSSEALRGRSRRSEVRGTRA
jgi:ketosteroid isomerase-like protein